MPTYYDENPWGAWGLDLDWDLDVGDFSFDWYTQHYNYEFRLCSELLHSLKLFL